MKWLWLALILPSVAFAQSVKLETCSLYWEPATGAAGYEIDSVPPEGDVQAFSFDADTTAIPCSRILSSGQTRDLILYSIDQSGNRSQGLPPLTVTTLGFEAPSKFCLEGKAEDGSIVNICVELQAQPLRFQWDAPQTNVDGSVLDDLAGYKFYSGSASRDYDESVTLGLDTTHTYEGEGQFFAVTAFDEDDNESDYSNEVWLGRTGGDMDVYLMWDIRRETGFVFDGGYTKTGQRIETTDERRIFDVYKVDGGPDYAFPGLREGWQSNYWISAFGCSLQDLDSKFQTTELTVGKRMFLDREYEVTSVAGLDGSTMVQTYNSDKRSTENPYLSFTCKHERCVNKFCVVWV